MSRSLVACDAGGTMTDVIIVDEERRDCGMNIETTIDTGTGDMS